MFDISRLSVNPAVFDTQKLEWMNGVYLRDAPSERLVELFGERLERDLPPAVARPLDRDLLAALAPLVRERIKLLPELAPLVDFFFTQQVATPALDELLGKPYRDDAAGAGRALAAAIARLDALDGWGAGPIESALREVAQELDRRAGDLFMLCRVAVTGKRVTPPLFETMEIVGREACLERLRAAERLAAGAAPTGGG